MKYFLILVFFLLLLIGGYLYWGGYLLGLQQSLNLSQTQNVVDTSNSIPVTMTPTIPVDATHQKVLLMSINGNEVSPKEFVISNSGTLLLQIGAVDKDYPISIPGWGVESVATKGQRLDIALERQGIGKQALFCGEGCFAVIEIVAESDDE